MERVCGISTPNIDTYTAVAFSSQLRAVEVIMEKWKEEGRPVEDVFNVLYKTSEAEQAVEVGGQEVRVCEERMKRLCYRLNLRFLLFASLVAVAFSSQPNMKPQNDVVETPPPEQPAAIVA